MPSQHDKPLGAEERFREAFGRLKSHDLKILKPGAPVTQNNVAREAGCDPSALKKVRFPDLVREIQAYVELHPAEQSHSTPTTKGRRSANRTARERLEDTIRQRDHVQSILTSANARIIELSEEVQSLRRQMDAGPRSLTLHDRLNPIKSAT